jgi:hypothetical protein
MDLQPRRIVDGSAHPASDCGVVVYSFVCRMRRTCRMRRAAPLRIVDWPTAAKSAERTQCRPPRPIDPFKPREFRVARIDLHTTHNLMKQGRVPLASRMRGGTIPAQESDGDRPGDPASPSNRNASITTASALQRMSGAGTALAIRDAAGDCDFPRRMQRTQRM